ncbi:MAG: hypothetical protein JXR83_05915 [Deltaproteobacteria bacterium]|nr:hypothetical protein [Deltaproteobacteria bacterium]
MKNWHRMKTLTATLAVGLAGALSTACPPPVTPKDAGPSHECDAPRDCGGGYDCVADADGIRRCVKLYCTTDEDCTATGANCHCDVRRGLCICGDNCRPDLPGSCPSGQVCLSGTCVDESQVPPADTCEITPSTLVVRAGQTANLSVAGFMSSGALAPLAAFNWATSADVCASVSSAGVVTGAAAATAICTATITASAVTGSATCTATVTTFPPVTLPTLRALVTEEFTGDPIAGAKVVVRTDDGSGGSILVVGGDGSNATGSDGVVTVADVGVSAANRLLDVSVFHANYGYITVVRPGTSDLLFVLMRNPDSAKMAGAKGTFDLSKVHSQGDIKLGIAGMSVPGSLTDIDFTTVLGPTVNRTIALEGVGTFENVPLPSGLYMWVGSSSIKDYIAAFGEPGRRILWGIGGKVSLSDVGPIITEVTGGDTSELDLGGLMSGVLPFFGTFDHALIGNLNLVEVDKPTTGEPETWTFDPAASQTLVPDKLLGQSATFAVPTLPKEPGTNDYISGAILFLGSLAPGAGWVPLGLTAGLDSPDADDPVDGVVDPAACPPNDPCHPPARGQVIVDFAAPHSGIEGSPYVALAMALGLESIGTALHTSLLFSIANTVSATEANTFPVAAFLDFPRGGAYHQGTGYSQTQGVTGASFYRLNLDWGRGKWQIYTDNATDIIMPTPPAGMERRDAYADIQVFKTFASSFGVRNLFEFSGTNVGDLLHLTGAFSTLECVTLEVPKVADPADNTGCYINGSDAGYTYDQETGLCEGGPNDVTAFNSYTTCPTGYEPSYVTGTSGKGICAKTPACRRYPSS